MFKRLLTVIFLCFSLTMEVLAQTEIYKCRDKDGVINFRSIPCNKKEYGIKKHPAKRVELNSDGTKKTRKQIIADKLKEEKEFLDLTKRQQKLEKKRQQKLAEHRRNILRNCEKAKKDLYNYQHSDSVSAKETEAKRRITYWCR